MNEPSLQTMPAADCFVRIVMIVLVGCAVGPLVAASVLWVELTLFKLHEGTAPPAAQSIAVWGQMLPFGYFVGVPYALLTSGVFALFAVLGGLRQLVLALMIASIPALLFVAVAAAAQPTLQIIGVSAMSFSVVGIATTVCWYLSRPWHSPST